MNAQNKFLKEIKNFISVNTGMIRKKNSLTVDMENVLLVSIEG